MMDGKEFFEDLAEILDAGAKHARGWSLNYAMQQQAEVLETMANRASEIAQRRYQESHKPDPNPLAEW